MTDTDTAPAATAGADPPRRRGDLELSRRRPAPTNGSPLAIRPDQTEWTPAQRAALTQVGLNEAPEADIAVFFHVCARTGLDPFARQIYMIGRFDRSLGRKKWTIQTGIDGFRLVSERHPQYAGVGDPAAEWCGRDGAWRDVWLADEPPVAARFTVHRRDQDRPIRAVARYSEYVELNDRDQPNRMWASKPAHMIGKCAEALARRMAFPQDLAGLYTEDEMAGAERDFDPVRVADNGRTVIDAGSAEPAAGPDWLALARQHEDAGDREELVRLWKLAVAARAGEDVIKAIVEAGDRLKARAEKPADRPAEPAEPAAKAEPARDPQHRPATQNQRTRMVLLIGEGGIDDDDQRRAVQGVLAGRPLTSSKELSNREAAAIVDRLAQAKRDGRLEAEVAAALAAARIDSATGGDDLPNPAHPDQWHTAGHPVRDGDAVERSATSDDCQVCADDAATAAVRAELGGEEITP